MLAEITGVARREEGFTLIELLVVVAIVALLATLAAPKLFDAINKSKATSGAADVQTISGALEQYYMDHDRYPAAGSLEADLQSQYLKATTTYHNGFRKGYIYITDGNGSYYVLVDVQNEGVGESVTITCNGRSETAVVSEGAPTTLESSLTATDVASGCTSSALTAPNEATITTN